MASVVARNAVGKPGRVLIVDDNQPLQESLSLVLRTFGYEVEIASDGVEALERITSASYDAILCDLLMPHMSGDQLFRACCEKHADVARRFIFMTGSACTAIMSDFLQHTTQPYLPKPCRVNEIRSAVEAMIATAPA
ncbi:MAG: response regulator [Armatimonadetes bacterium]|nr:response regulator [Armatimonadota bacterium]